MISLPIAFDENEVYIIIWLILSFCLFFLLPKRFPLSITIVMMLLGVVIAKLFDHLLSSPELNFYNLMDTGKYELFDIISYCLYAPFAYFFIYFFDKLHIRGLGIFLYILVWSWIGIMFEGISVIFHFFNYHGWKLTYSFGVYLITQSLTLLLFRFLMHVHQRKTGTKV
ncbi:hypothetical protein KK120_07805 [Virgibacillus dakarensis]|nr:hypothetical protein [Virgibacillus dakarensis]